ncbi:MAG TPA: hypothetical protein PLM29_01360 [Deltaproteobacteria bacterium]|nr:hypothetical protein [Deltaproteobacteria bacterium]
MNGLRRFSAGMLLLMLVVIPFPVSADTTIGDYTFSDDSTELDQNPYFSTYERGVDFQISLYGYGGFGGYTLSQEFHQYFTLDGIECAVIREHIDIPYSGDSSSSVDVHDIYLYYAKDTEDNIHILQMAYSGDQGSMGWIYTDLPEGITTLKYPKSPSSGQDIFFGSVGFKIIPLGEVYFTTLKFDALPYCSDTVTEYLTYGSGLFSMSYGGVSGYSATGFPPELLEEDESGWEEWKEDHCFITACSP